MRSRALTRMDLERAPMSSAEIARLTRHWRQSPDDQRFDRAAARIADSELRLGNAVTLLRDAQENYPAWLQAIRAAERVIHFENFIFADDETGRAFARALAERAAAGVKVRVLYDWLGSSGRALPGFWARLERSGVEVRVFNPPRLSAPFWIRRNHRKLLTADGRVGFVSGLCVSDSWPGRATAAWRDTGLALKGPLVADLDWAFAESWALAGAPIASEELPDPDLIPAAGIVPARVISGRPGTYRTYRLDQFIAATAQRNLWLTDAYFVATTSYVQALAEAARDGVDVRLLVPGSSDVQILQPIVRAGYRPLIEAGIRVFEWNGPMLHAKTAVADGRWSRVGSTNLNIASWATNWELDVVVEDDGLRRCHGGDVPGGPRQRHRDRAGRERSAAGIARDALRRALAGSRRARAGVGRLAAGAIALGNTVGTAIAGSRSLTATEARSIATIGAASLGLGDRS